MESYSSLDKFVHRLIYGARGLQMTASDIERALYAKQYRDLPLEKPIFITSLARAGTTILLEALNRFPGLATHLYRDMPLVQAPILWERLMGKFRKDTGQNMRAHGDGLMIGQDSPEAFEEVIWMDACPRHYKGDRITLWNMNEPLDDLKSALEETMRKTIFLRCQGEKGRYISKNNANVIRTEILAKLFPDCLILIPVRDPVTHAASLLRQHQNFLKQHAEDAFVRKYMQDIGHFEFGALHKPFDVPEFEARCGPLETTSPDYWLTYWIALYSHVLSKSGDPHISMISAERLAADPYAGLTRIAEMADLQGEETLRSAAALFKPAPPRNTEGFSAHLIEEADSLHQALLKDSLV